MSLCIVWSVLSVHVIIMTIDGMSYQWNCSQRDAESRLYSLPDLIDDAESVIERNSEKQFQYKNYSSTQFLQLWTAMGQWKQWSSAI